MAEQHVDRTLEEQVEHHYLTLLKKLDHSISDLEDAISAALKKDEIVLAKGLTVVRDSLQELMKKNVKLRDKLRHMGSQV